MGEQQENRLFSESEKTPIMTCLIVSHNKPIYCRQAIQSVLSQSFDNWQAIVFDSGVLYDKNYFDFIKDSRFQVIRSNETNELRSRVAMAPWCFNECFRRGLVTGDLVTYLCDDDIWYDNAFSTFVGFWLDNPYVQAMYASQDVIYCESNGSNLHAGERRAMNKIGRSVYCPPLDCTIDYLQFCHTKSILGRLGNEYWPENRATETHADGVFMDKIGNLVPVYPIDIKVGQNRRTPNSTYVPSR